MTPTALLIGSGALGVALFLILTINFAKTFRDFDSLDFDDFGKKGAIHILIAGALTLDLVVFIGALVWYATVHFQ